jgi:hypothetical protein
MSSDGLYDGFVGHDKRALALACTSALGLALGADSEACDVVVVPSSCKSWSWSLTVPSDSLTESKRDLVLAFACAETSGSLGLWLCLKSNIAASVSRGETGLGIVGVVNLVILSVVKRYTVLMVVFRGPIALLIWKYFVFVRGFVDGSLFCISFSCLSGSLKVHYPSLSLVCSLFLTP